MERTQAPPTSSPADRSPGVAEARPDPPAQRSDASEPARVPEPRAEPESRPVRRWALVILGICALLFAYHLFADRLTPFTTQASVNAFVVPVSPEVAGLVTEVNVVDNQKVEAGEVLVRVDAERYQFAVAEAEATLAQSGQDVSAAAANVSTAQAQLDDAHAHLAHMRKQSVRIENLVAQRAMAAAHRDQAIAAVTQAEAAVAAAEANLPKAKEQLGPRGSDNPKVKAAISALRVARRQLEDTTIRAPARRNHGPSDRRRELCGRPPSADDLHCSGRGLDRSGHAGKQPGPPQDRRSGRHCSRCRPGSGARRSRRQYRLGRRPRAGQRSRGTAFSPFQPLLGARIAAFPGAHPAARKSITTWRSCGLASKRHRLHGRSSGPRCSRPPPDPVVQHPDVCLLKRLGRIFLQRTICIGYRRKGGRCGWCSAQRPASRSRTPLAGPPRC